MTEKNEKKVNRREFVKGGVTTAAIGMSCLKFGLKEALAAARDTGKPILTERNLNSFITKNAANIQALAAEAKRDLKGFISNRFTLTPAQETFLDSISKEDIEKLNKGLKMIEEKGGTVKIRFIERTITERSTRGLDTRGLGLLLLNGGSSEKECEVDVKITTPMGSAELHIKQKEKQEKQEEKSKKKKSSRRSG
ncbi:MAG: hypothetical protein JST84_03980 [Acidobacteria bacterium]|nr:hypothetical protein [Acidobacteriota bacterium]